jgi:hypothetical protein
MAILVRTTIDSPDDKPVDGALVGLPLPPGVAAHASTKSALTRPSTTALRMTLPQAFDQA